MLDQESVRRLEGHRVGLGLANGSRIDHAKLVSVGRPTTGSLRLFVDGIDVFVPYADVVVLWDADGCDAAA